VGPFFFPRRKDPPFEAEALSPRFIPLPASFALYVNLFAIKLDGAINAFFQREQATVEHDYFVRSGFRKTIDLALRGFDSTHPNYIRAFRLLQKAATLWLTAYSESNKNE
jgi:hypothetical protein